MPKDAGKPIVVKIGGSTLGASDTSLEDIAQLQQQGKQVVVVHGGGKIITDWLTKHGVATKFVQGERVTDAESLKVVVAVLAGLVNKELVSTINAAGGKAIGISGVDGGLVQAKVKNKELGYVGEPTKVNATPLKALLMAGYIPVIAPVSAGAPSGPKDAAILNINADGVAGEIAAAIGAERLIFLTDVAGVADASGKVFANLSPGQVEGLITSGVISGGMIPKIRSCIRAVAASATARIIDGRQVHALLMELEGRCLGTTIEAARK